MRKFTLTLFYCVSCICSIAQKNFIEAIITKTNGEEQSGYLNYKEWVKSPNEVSFKTSLSQSPTNYSVEDLKGFKISFNQDSYEVLDFSFEKLPHNASKPVFENLTKYATRNRNIVTRKAFVRVLATGRINLYQFVDNDLDEEFIIKQNDSLEVLTYHIIETPNKVAFIKEYQNQLEKTLINSCNSLSINQTDYTEESLRKLINIYNKCFSDISPNPAVKNQNKWMLGLMGGGSYSYFTYNYPTTYQTYAIKGTHNIEAFGGIFLNYNFLRGKFTLSNELITHSFKSSTDFDNRKINFDFRYVSFQSIIYYNFYSKKNKLYLLSGLSNGYIIKQNSTIVERGNIYNLSDDFYYSRLIRKDEQAFIGGFGIGSKRLLIEARYRKGNGFFASQASKSPTNRLELVLKMNFLK